MPTENDPRVFFAAERTLLAWLRTGLAVIGVGFLVARFGLFLKLMRHPTGDVSPPIFSSLIGIGFVLIGTLMISLAAWQQTRFCSELTADQRPNRYWMNFSVFMAWLISSLSIALAAYLLITSGLLGIGQG
ncbi:YidH family protein [Anatilimnocola sp. NA78]|uniref:YidH family protein n=1 Tax=Anatilimnocola sp. NA78 TaxID=3415683 RepID=UPI003CE5065F